MKKLNYCFKCGTELEWKRHEDRERYYCPGCGEIRFRDASPVGGVFVVRGDEVLMVKRGREPHKDKWSYPAGFLEFDESPETGAVRELQEETGLKVDKKELELVSTIHLEHPDKYVVGNAYTASYRDTKGKVEAGSDAADAKFWTVEEMRDNLEKMESEKVVDAAEKAIKLVS